MTKYRTLATARHHGMELTDLEFTVPLDHRQPSGESLAIFARAVKDSEASTEKRPWLIFLQGGPGYPGPRPLGKSGWLKRALDEYHVLLLDSRGEEIGAGQHEIDVAATRALHRLQFAWQLRGGGPDNVHCRNTVRVLLHVLVDRRLRQSEITRRVADVDRHRRLCERCRRADREQRRCRSRSHRGAQDGAAVAKVF